MAPEQLNMNEREHKYEILNQDGNSCDKCSDGRGKWRICPHCGRSVPMATWPCRGGCGGRMIDHEKYKIVNPHQVRSHERYYDAVYACDKLYVTLGGDHSCRLIELDPNPVFPNGRPEGEIYLDMATANWRLIAEHLPPDTQLAVTYPWLMAISPGRLSAYRVDMPGQEIANATTLKLLERPIDGYVAADVKNISACWSMGTTVYYYRAAQKDTGLTSLNLEEIQGKGKPAIKDLGSPAINEVMGDIAVVGRDINDKYKLFILSPSWKNENHALKLIEYSDIQADVAYAPVYSTDGVGYIATTVNGKPHLPVFQKFQIGKKIVEVGQPHGLGIPASRNWTDWPCHKDYPVELILKLQKRVASGENLEALAEIVRVPWNAWPVEFKQQ